MRHAPKAVATRLSLQQWRGDHEGCDRKEGHKAGFDNAGLKAGVVKAAHVRGEVLLTEIHDEVPFGRCDRSALAGRGLENRHPDDDRAEHGRKANTAQSGKVDLRAGGCIDAVQTGLDEGRDLMNCFDHFTRYAFTTNFVKFRSNAFGPDRAMLLKTHGKRGVIALKYNGLSRKSAQILQAGIAKTTLISSGIRKDEVPT